MNVVDPLRAKTFGVKKPLEEPRDAERPDETAEGKGAPSLPKNKKGAVDEWLAMEQQKQRAIDALNLQRKEEGKVAKKLYNEDLADLAKLKDIEKKQEVLNKELEKQDIKAQHYEYMAAVSKLKDEDKEFKKFIGESYASQMSAQKQKETEEHQRRLEEEKARLDLLQKQIDEERKQKAQQKMIMRKEMGELLQKKKEQKEFEREMQNLSQEEQRKMMEERARKELEREQHYKQHFEDYDKLMQERLKMHMATVSSPESTKSAQLHDWVRKHEAEYQEKLKEKERELEQWRKINLSNTYKEVKAQLDQKEQEKVSYKKNYVQRAEENLRLVEANKDYRSKLMQEKAEQQKTYSDILATQLKLKDDITAKYGTMTDTERRMNMRDLKTYMNNGAVMASLIPGINNIPSVGSKPTCRGGKAIVMSTGYPSMSPSRQQITAQGMGESPTKQLSPSTYNPITNPIPNYSQNPYIRKQKQMAFSGRSGSLDKISGYDKEKREDNN